MPRATSADRSGRTQEELADEVCDWDYRVGARWCARERLVVTEAERRSADLLPIEVDPVLARAIVETVPFWFHRFALNRAEGIFTAGSARDRLSRVSALPEDFAGMSVLDVGCFDGFYAFLTGRRGGPRRSWRWTTSSIGCGSLPGEPFSWRAGGF